jgi:DNA-binding protein H-NS
VDDRFNYFSYFTEIEEQYLRRRGGGLLLTTLDWALIETWKDAGIPLEAALRGIDAAFDRYDQRAKKTKKINSLAFCSQEVLASAEDMKEAASVSAEPSSAESTSGKTSAGQGFEPETIAAFLHRNADLLEAAKLPSSGGISVKVVAQESAATLRKLAQESENRKTPLRLEDLERHLNVLEEKLFAVLLAAAPDEDVVAVRTQADRELAPYRSKMAAAQVEQLQKQYVHKRLLEKYGLPRLSLFYM